MNSLRRTLLLTFSLLAATLVLGTASVEGQQDMRAVFKEGVQLYEQKRYAEALQRFEKVLQESPSFVYARSYANRCRTAMSRSVGPEKDLESRLSRLTVPKIEFNEAPIGDVLEFFTAKARELSNGEVNANFIYKGTRDQRLNTLVTLSLKNVPMTEAIRYVGQLTSTRFKYEEHAVVADPNLPTTERSTSGKAADSSDASGATKPNIFE